MNSFRLRMAMTDTVSALAAELAALAERARQIETSGDTIDQFARFELLGHLVDVAPLLALAGVLPLIFAKQLCDVFENERIAKEVGSRAKALRLVKHDKKLAAKKKRRRSIPARGLQVIRSHAFRSSHYANFLTRSHAGQFQHTTSRGLT